MMNRLSDQFLLVGWARRALVGVGVLSLDLLAMQLPAMASENFGEVVSQSSAMEESWTEEVGVALGGGLGMKVFGSDLDHHFALSKIHYGWNRNRTYFNDFWFRGELGVLNEFMVGGQFDPEGAYVLGLTPVLRYRFNCWERLRPFVEGAAGIMLTDVGTPSLGSVFEFYQQAGLGLEWKQSEALSLAIQSRFVHVSNAGITRSNRGINNLFFFIGANWAF